MSTFKSRTKKCLVLLRTKKLDFLFGHSTHEGKALNGRKEGSIEEKFDLTFTRGHGFFSQIFVRGEGSEILNVGGRLKIYFLNFFQGGSRRANFPKSAEFFLSKPVKKEN